MIQVQTIRFTRVHQAINAAAKRKHSAASQRVSYAALLAFVTRQPRLI